jgi:hypothetical protein
MNYAFQVTVGGARSVRLVSELPEVRRQVWSVLRVGGVVDWVKAGHHWFTRGELIRLVESIVAAAPRPIPAAVAVGVCHVIGRRGISR